MFNRNTQAGTRRGTSALGGALVRAAWWWIDRWRKSTAYTDMTLAEQGAYRNLLDELWLRDGVLPNDDRILGRIAGSEKEWRKVRRKVLQHFVLTSTGFRNATHDEVSAQSLRRAQKQKTYRERLKLVSSNRAGNVAGNDGRNKPGSPSPSPYTEGLKNNPSVRRPAKQPPDGRIKVFLDWFQVEYKSRRAGADYLVRWEKDGALVKQMLGATTLPRLKILAQIMLSEKCADEFVQVSDRGVGVLSARFNWLSDRLAEWERKNGTTPSS